MKGCLHFSCTYTITLKNQVVWTMSEIVTFLHRKWISPRKLFLAQGKVFPRAVFNPPRVGLYIPSEANEFPRKKHELAGENSG